VIVGDDADFVPGEGSTDVPDGGPGEDVIIP